MVLFADLETGIIENAGTNDLGHLRRSVSALAKLASIFEMPVVVTASPGEGLKLMAELTTELGETTQYLRGTADAFDDPATRDAILKIGRKSLLIAGVATEIIVQHSALSAVKRGFQVQVVVDACAGISSRTEDAAFQRMTQAGVVMTSMVSIVGQLAGNFTDPHSGDATQVLYSLFG